MALEQEGFRWRNDDGAEGGSPSGASWKAAQDSNVSIALDTAIRLRTIVNHSGGAAPGASNYRLEARLLSSPTEDWFEVAPAGSPVVGNAKIQLVPSSNITAGGEDTSAQLTPPAGSPKSFTAGRIWDDESGSDSITIGLDQYTELEWCLRALSAQGAGAGDVYQFRVTRRTAVASGPGDISFVQGGGTSTANSATAPRAFGSNVTAGNKIIIFAHRAGTTPGDPFVAGDCAKSAGTATIGTVSLLAEEEVAAATVTAYIGIWAADVTGTGSLTMTITGVAGDYWTVSASEISSTTGWDGSFLEDSIVNSTETDDTNASTGNVSSAGKAIFIGGVTPSEIAPITITPDAAFTEIFEQEDDGSFCAGSSIYKIVSSGDTDSFDWTLSANNAWAAVGVVIKGAG